MTGLLGWGGATEALADCDLLLMLGTDFPYHAFLPAGKTIIQVDDKPLHLGRRAAVDLGLVGDVGETLRALIPLLEARTDSHVPRQGGQAPPHDGRRASRPTSTHEGSGQGLRPEMVATALSDLAEDDAVFTVDTGMCNVWGARYLEMKPGRRILASFSHGSMANAMPQAIGAKVGSPGPPGRRAVRRRWLLDADGRAAHRRRSRHPGQADDLQQLHARHGARRDDGGRLPAVGHRREEPRLRRAGHRRRASTASGSRRPPTSARPSSAPSPTPARP